MRNHLSNLSFHGYAVLKVKCGVIQDDMMARAFAINIINSINCYLDNYDECQKYGVA